MDKFISGSGYLLVLIVVCIVGAGIGAYVLLSGTGGQPSTGGENVPSGGETGGTTTIISADFWVDATFEGTTMTAHYQAKDVNTEQPKIRVETTIQGISGTIIIDLSSNAAYIEYGGTWYSIPITDPTYVTSYKSNFEGYEDYLAAWEGGEIHYTDPVTGTSVRIYNIQLNVDLPDSLFQPTGPVQTWPF